MEENIVKSEKMKLSLRHSTAMKILAFILAIIMLALCAASALGAVAMWEYEAYTTSKECIYRDLASGIAWSDAHNIAYYVGTNNFDAVRDEILSGSNIIAADIACSGEQNWTWSYGTWAEDAEADFETTWVYSVSQNGNAIPGHGSPAGNNMRVRLLFAPAPSGYDQYWMAYTAAELIYGLRYAVYPVALIALAFFVICVVFLLNAAGHRPHKPGVTPAWTTAIPFDLLTAAIVLLIALSVVACDGVLWSPIHVFLQAACVAAVVLADLIMVLLWMMSAALRIKLGVIFKNTLIFMVLRLCWRALKWYWRLLGKFWQALRRSGERVALFWKTVLVFAAICLVEFIIILATQFDPFPEFVLWLVTRLLLLAGLLYICHILRQLYLCGKAVAEGEEGFEVDTRLMPSQFREHGEHICSLSAAVNRAVE